MDGSNEILEGSERGTSAEMSSHPYSSVISTSEAGFSMQLDEKSIENANSKTNFSVAEVLKEETCLEEANPEKVESGAETKNGTSELAELTGKDKGEVEKGGVDENKEEERVKEADEKEAKEEEGKIELGRVVSNKVDLKGEESSSSDGESSDEEDEEAFRMSLLRKGGVASEGEAKSNAFDADDSDDEFDRDLQAEVNDMEDVALEEEGPTTSGPPRTANEEEYSDDPSLPTMAPPSSDLVLAGRISVLLPNDILVTSADHTKTWDVDSVLCLKDGTILGRIVELIGRIDRPSYRIVIETSPPKQKGKDSMSKSKAKSLKVKAKSSDLKGSHQASQILPTHSEPVIEHNESDHPNIVNNDTSASNNLLLSSTMMSNESGATPEASAISLPKNEAVEILPNDPLPSKESEPTSAENESDPSTAATTASITTESITTESIITESDPSATEFIAPESTTIRVDPSPEEEAEKKVAEFYARRKALRSRLEIGNVVLCVAEWSKVVNTTAAMIKGSDASNAWDEEVADDELDFSDDEEERVHRERLKNQRRLARANGLAGDDHKAKSRGGNAKRNSSSTTTSTTITTSNQPSSLPPSSSNASNGDMISQSSTTPLLHDAQPQEAFVTSKMLEDVPPSASIENQMDSTHPQVNAIETHPQVNAIETHPSSVSSTSNPETFLEENASLLPDAKRPKLTEME